MVVLGYDGSEFGRCCCMLLLTSWSSFLTARYLLSGSTSSYLSSIEDVVSKGKMRPKIRENT